MSKSVQTYMNFLKILSKKSPKKRKLILHEFSNDKVLYKALSELSHNLIKGNIPVENKRLKRLRRHQNIFKELNCPKNKKCKTKRRKLIEQSGGFLPILIPAAIAVLGHLSGALIKKAIK